MQKFKTIEKIYNHPVGQIIYAQIPWDSNLLGNQTFEMRLLKMKKHGEINLFNNFLKTINFKKGDLIYFKLDPYIFATSLVLQKWGFYFIELSARSNIKITDRFNTNPYMQDGYYFRKATKDDLIPLQVIAAEVFSIDRYHRDPNILKAKADRRSMGWIKNSFKNKQEYIICLCNFRKKIIGFFIVKITGDFAELQLIGLKNDYQGKGLGKLLYQEAMVYIKKLTNLENATSHISMSNGPALTMNQFIGAKFDEFRFVYHFSITH